MLALTMPRFRAGEALSEADLGLRSSQSRRVTAEDSNEEALSGADRGLRSSQSCQNNHSAFLLRFAEEQYK